MWLYMCIVAIAMCMSIKCACICIDFNFFSNHGVKCMDTTKVATYMPGRTWLRFLWSDTLHFYIYLFSRCTPIQIAIT